MLFGKVGAAVATVSLASQVSGIPTLNSRSTPAPSAWPELHRAAQLSSAAYTGCVGQAFDVTITKKIDDLFTDTQGYVGYSNSKKRITLAMRGSTTLTDILNDIDTTLVTPSLSGVEFPPGAEVMEGVYGPWSSVHDDVISEVKRLAAKYPDYALESTGHSLGGSLTYLSYIALVQNFPDKEVTSNAMAAFPIGNSVFADFGGSLKGTLNRGNNAADGVPNMYVTAPYNFQHYGTEYYSFGTKATCVECEGQRDLTCSAGNGMVGVTIGHFQSFGVSLGAAGCGIL